MIYDGGLLEAGEEVQQSADIRMIDFEHSTFPGYLKDPLHEGPDQGYLLGLDTLAAIITDFIQTAESPNSAQSSIQ